MGHLVLINGPKGLDVEILPVLVIGGLSINDVTQIKTIFILPSPYRHTFYYQELGIMITKSLTPSPLRP